MSSEFDWGKTAGNESQLKIDEQQKKDATRAESEEAARLSKEQSDKAARHELQTQLRKMMLRAEKIVEAYNSSVSHLEGRVTVIPKDANQFFLEKGSGQVVEFSLEGISSLAIERHMAHRIVIGNTISYPVNKEVALGFTHRDAAVNSELLVDDACKWIFTTEG